MAFGSRVGSAVEAGRLAAPVVVVLGGDARDGVEEGESGGVTVVHAPASGDDMIVALASDATGEVTLVSADRELRRRVEAGGAGVAGPGWFLARFYSTGERSGLLGSCSIDLSHDAAAVSLQFGQLEPILFAIVRKRGQATPDHDRKSHEPQFIDQTMLEQCPHKGGAPGHDVGPPSPAWRVPAAEETSPARTDAFQRSSWRVVVTTCLGIVFIFSANSPSC